MIDNKQLVEIFAIDNLKRTVQNYGLEGTVEAIERVYDCEPKLKEYMLSVFNKNFLRR